MIGRDILGIEDLSRDEIETILETAARLDWTVVSMQNDWETVFPD